MLAEVRSATIAGGNSRGAVTFFRAAAVRAC